MLSTKDMNNLRQSMGDAMETEPIGDYEVAHLDYSYVATCTDIKELVLLLDVLRSGKEGSYPELESAIERRMDEVDPRRERNHKPTDARLPVMDVHLADELKQLSSELRAKDTLLRSKPKQQQSSRSTKPTSTALLELETPPPSSQPTVTSEKSTKKSYDTTRIMKDKPVVPVDIKVPLDATEEELTYLAEHEKRKGNECFRSGDFEEAIQYYTRSLHLSPPTSSSHLPATLHTNLALTHLKLNHFSQAEHHATLALSLPSLPLNLRFKAYHRRAVARSKRGVWDGAREDCVAALGVEGVGEGERREVERLERECAGRMGELGMGVGKRGGGRTRVLVEEVEGGEEGEEGGEGESGVEVGQDGVGKNEEEEIEEEPEQLHQNMGRIQILEVEDDEDEDDEE
ncbi:hypothetical protein HDV00_001975 [Rhizophlyctis rosea]|nr:hypothetical protein HDV00_001975 [Rhizophlyctis rosea]